MGRPAGPPVRIARKRGSAYIDLGPSAGKALLETPCINVCLLDDATETCVGCGRTIEEISGWAAMSDSERRAVMAALPVRKQRLEQAKG